MPIRLESAHNAAILQTSQAVQTFSIDIKGGQLWGQL